jgi:hypothetical protein
VQLLCRNGQSTCRITAISSRQLERDEDHPEGLVRLRDLFPSLDRTSLALNRTDYSESAHF